MQWDRGGNETDGAVRQGGQWDSMEGRVLEGEFLIGSDQMVRDVEYQSYCSADWDDFTLTWSLLFSAGLEVGVLEGTIHWFLDIRSDCGYIPSAPTKIYQLDFLNTKISILISRDIAYMYPFAQLHSQDWHYFIHKILISSMKHIWL